jgi:hypothetical protein
LRSSLKRAYSRLVMHWFPRPFAQSEPDFGPRPYLSKPADSHVNIDSCCLASPGPSAQVHYCRTNLYTMSSPLLLFTLFVSSLVPLPTLARMCRKLPQGNTQARLDQHSSRLCLRRSECGIGHTAVFGHAGARGSSGHTCGGCGCCGSRCCCGSRVSAGGHLGDATMLTAHLRMQHNSLHSLFG